MPESALVSGERLPVHLSRQHVAANKAWVYAVVGPPSQGVSATQERLYGTDVTLLIRAWAIVQPSRACTVQAACPQSGSLAVATSLIFSNARWWMLCSCSQRL